MSVRDQINIRSLQEDVAALKRTIEELVTRIELLDARRGPGRPPKVREDDG